MSDTGAESAAPAYILYSAATPNGFKISIMLEEIGATYETRIVDLSKGEQNDPAYLRLNPNGKIPTLIDRSEGDFVIFESGAILLYLARKVRRFLGGIARAGRLTRQRNRQGSKTAAGGAAVRVGVLDGENRVIPCADTASPPLLLSRFPAI